MGSKKFAEASKKREMAKATLTTVPSVNNNRFNERQRPIYIMMKKWWTILK